MSLEQDIQQEQFESAFHKTAVNILFTSSWLYNLNALRLKPFDITPEQFNVLRILRGSHPDTMMLSDISRRMLDKSSNATRLLDKLCRKGLTERKKCKSNRRKVDISITPSGLQMLSKIDKGSADWLKDIKNISEAEARELNRILDKLRG